MKMRMRQQRRHLNTIPRRNQKIIIPIRHRHGDPKLPNPLIRILRTRPAKHHHGLRLALRELGAQMRRPVLRPLEDALPGDFGGCLTVRRVIEEGQRPGGFEFGFRDGLGESAVDGPVAYYGVGGPAGASAGEGELVDEGWGLEANKLSRSPAHGEAEKVDLRDLEGV
jgi:hypothetical protein